MTAYYATEHGKDVQKRWRKANPEKQLEYQNRWLAKHPEKLSEYRAKKVESVRRWRAKMRAKHPAATLPVFTGPRQALSIDSLLKAVQSIVDRRAELETA
jgi:hypothetical protein